MESLSQTPHITVTSLGRVTDLLGCVVRDASLTQRDPDSSCTLMGSLVSTLKKKFHTWPKSKAREVRAFLKITEH